MTSLLAVRLDGRGDITKSHITWTLKRGAPLTPSPLLVGTELYLISDNGVASCVDAKTGNPYWQRLGGNHSASPIYADGRIYFLSEEGESVVIAPGKRLKALAQNQLDGQTLASIAVSSGPQPDSSLLAQQLTPFNRVFGYLHLSFSGTAGKNFSANDYSQIHSW